MKMKRIGTNKEKERNLEVLNKRNGRNKRDSSASDQSRSQNARKRSRSERTKSKDETELKIKKLKKKALSYKREIFRLWSEID